MNLLSPLTLGLLQVIFNPMSGRQEGKWRSFVLSSIAVLLLISGYIVGSLSLYEYLTLQWGGGLALLTLSLLYGGTGIVLLLIARLIKPKKIFSSTETSPIEITPFLKTLAYLPTNQILTKIISNTSLKTLSSLFVIALLASYFSKPKKDSY